MISSWQPLYLLGALISTGAAKQGVTTPELTCVELQRRVSVAPILTVKNIRWQMKLATPISVKWTITQADEAETNLLLVSKWKQNQVKKT